VLSTPPPRVVQPPTPQPPPQIQLRLPDFSAAPRGGTRTDVAPASLPPPPPPDVWWRERQIRALPPGLRELYSAWIGAGRFAMVTPGLDVLSRWFRREDPTAGLEAFRREAEAAARAAPLAHAVGQGVGVFGLGGLAVHGLMARGAALGVRGAVEQVLAGLRAGAKTAAAGGAAGAAAGAAVGAATGRDPFAEAVRFGVLGATAGLGATRYQLAAGGILGGVVGGTTAMRHGVEKGIEAGAAVFPLPLVLPERLARGFFTGFAAERRTAAGLRAVPGREVPVDWVQLRRGLSPEEVARYASELRFNPDEQRAFFKMLVEEALAKHRADDVGALPRLRDIMKWLDLQSRRRFEEVLREYGLVGIKHRTHELDLRDESARLLRFLFRRTPEYQLADETAPVLDRLFRRDAQRAPQYQLADEAAPLLGHFFRRDMRRPAQYQLTDEAAALLNQFLRMDDKTVQIFRRVPPEDVVPVFRRRKRDVLRRGQETWLVAPNAQIQLFRPRRTAATAPQVQPAVVPTQAGGTRPADEERPVPTVAPVIEQPQRTPLEQPQDEQLRTPPIQPPATPPPKTLPHIPSWMLSLPVSVALPLLAKMGLKLPPPPNPNMPLGTYLRMLRFPALGRQREVFVLI
jgi:hypothetical protein